MVEDEEDHPAWDEAALVAHHRPSRVHPPDLNLKLLKLRLKPQPVDHPRHLPVPNQLGHLLGHPVPVGQDLKDHLGPKLKLLNKDPLQEVHLDLEDPVVHDPLDLLVSKDLQFPLVSKDLPFPRVNTDLLFPRDNIDHPFLLDSRDPHYHLEALEVRVVHLEVRFDQEDLVDLQDLDSLAQVDQAVLPHNKEDLDQLVLVDQVGLEHQ